MFMFPKSFTKLSEKDDEKNKNKTTPTASENISTFKGKILIIVD